MQLRWLMCLLCLAITCGDLSAADVEWVGEGGYRLLVTVEATEGSTQRSDQRPAELHIDFDKQLKSLGINGLADIGSIQVIPYDSTTGGPRVGAKYKYAVHAAESPLRWYDAAIPYDFPEFADAVSRSNGKIVRRNRVRAGYFFNAIGQWKRGRLVWMHTETADGVPMQYAVYFDVLSDGAQPTMLPPRAWVGDGTPRCDRDGSSTTGADHSRIELDDWNGDGLLDLIIGEQTGHVFWWPNLGTREFPDFRYGKFIEADDGPLDSGLTAAPKVVDWDGDGVKDLLVGTHWNRLLFYRNVGTNVDRKLVLDGPVMIEGDPLELPIRPLERGSENIFKRDYYPIPETVDWDADGDLDLLAGGYVTGMVFFYENVGKRDDGTPQLKLRGPLNADGKPLNVGHWCAAPCAADFDGDGDLDLMSGNMPMYVKPDERSRHEHDFLQYFENVGTATGPELKRRRFPEDERFPHGRLATPRTGDWDGDGDLDLAVSSGRNVYLMKNAGSLTEPRFQTDVEPIRVPWGLAEIAVNQFRDWDGDGQLDLVRAYQVRLNSGAGNPFLWKTAASVLPPGRHIAHPSGIGDDWFWPHLDDFDGDGRIDILFGDWSGHVWWHRNISTPDQQQFDFEGVRLKLESGELIKVGPIAKDSLKSFDALQGARTVFSVADFDGDSQRDLVIGDTYGKIRTFQNQGVPTAAIEPVFAEGVEIGDLGIRGLVDTADWNADGRPDVIASAANGRVRVYLNEGDGQFAEGVDPGLPPILQPRVLMVDINGDGDEDLFLPSTQGSCFVERSFLERGYAAAKLDAAECRP